MPATVPAALPEIGCSAAVKVVASVEGVLSAALAVAGGLSAGFVALDVSKVEQKITARTKAIVPVHLYGQMVDMEPLLKLAAKKNIPVPFDRTNGNSRRIVPADVELTFEPGTQPGKVQVLRGRGLPVLQGFGRGDQRVLVNVAVPRHLSEEQRRLLEQFDQLSTDATYESSEGFFEKLKSAFR